MAYPSQRGEAVIATIQRSYLLTRLAPQSIDIQMQLIVFDIRTDKIEFYNNATRELNFDATDNYR